MALARPSPDDLRAFSESVLLYDFEMASELGQFAVRILLRQVECEWYLENAARESLMIRARALVDFFYSPRRRAQDAVVEDYFPDSAAEWRPPRPEAISKPVLGRIGGEVAHATYRRTQANHERPAWWPYAVFAAVADVMEPFADAVNPSLVVDDFAERVRSAIPHRQPERYRPDLAVGQTRTTSRHPPLWFEDAS